MHEITMRRMHLDEIEAEALGALCRLHEGFLDLVHAGAIECLGRMPARIERDRRGADRLPGALVGLERCAALPRNMTGGLAPGMGELDADRRLAIGAAGVDRALHRRLVGVGIEAGAARG